MHIIHNKRHYCDTDRHMELSWGLGVQRKIHDHYYYYYIIIVIILIIITLMIIIITYYH